MYEKRNYEDWEIKKLMWKQFMINGELQMRKICSLCGMDHYRLGLKVSCTTKTCGCTCNDGRY